MINVNELLLNISNVSDGYRRNGAAAANELAARKLLITEYIKVNNLPETIAKAQVGEVVQKFAYFYM